VFFFGSLRAESKEKRNELHTLKLSGGDEEELDDKQSRTEEVAEGCATTTRMRHW
jgi:hypothetical protein